MIESTSSPNKKDYTRLCIAGTRDGVTAYGNKAAFENLAEFFTWMASSVPSEHYECHTIMHLQDDASKFEGKEIKNAYVLFDKDTQPVFAKKTENEVGFELTFMMATETDLDQSDIYQKHGLLPDSWNTDK